MIGVVLCCIAALVLAMVGRRQPGKYELWNPSQGGRVWVRVSTWTEDPALCKPPGGFGTPSGRMEVR